MARYNENCISIIKSPNYQIIKFDLIFFMKEKYIKLYGTILSGAIYAGGNVH